MKELVGNILDKWIFRNQKSGIASSKKEELVVHKVLPHGDLVQVLENIWFATGQVKMPMLFPPLHMSRSMTVIRHPDRDELTIVNSMRLSDKGLRELDKIGKVTNVLRIAGFHCRDDAFYRERYGARIFALNGQVYTREMMKPPTDARLGYLQPDVWLQPGDAPPVANASLKWFSSCRPVEAILVIPQDGGTLVAGDSLQHTPAATEYHNWASKIMMKKFDFFNPHNVGPGWVQFAKPTLADVRSIMDLEFANVLP
jgi:hypothetical protein